MDYIGNELDLFALAVHWKTYLSRKVAPLLGTEVLEVGAGLGTNTLAFCTHSQKRWLCVEPDAKLLSRLSDRIKKKPGLSSVELREGTIDCVHENESFTSILYIDVLEHIENDKLELQRAAQLLQKNGVLVVVAPAHQWLYSPFDKAIGHFRRYNKATLRAISPTGLRLKEFYYLDSAGMFASIGNLLILKKSQPTVSQIALWDNWLVPVSTTLDRLFGYRIGKTIVSIWEKC